MQKKKDLDGLIDWFALVAGFLLGRAFASSSAPLKPVFEFTINNLKIKGEFSFMQLRDTQQRTGKLSPIDAKGNLATVQPGSVKFSSSDETIFTVSQDSADEENLIVVAQKPGVAQLDWAFKDADGNDHSGHIAVDVQPGEAVNAGIAFEAPVEQAAPVATTPTTPAPTTTTGSAETTNTGTVVPDASGTTPPPPPPATPIDTASGSTGA